MSKGMRYVMFGILAKIVCVSVPTMKIDSQAAVIPLRLIGESGDGISNKKEAVSTDPTVPHLMVQKVSHIERLLEQILDHMVASQTNEMTKRDACVDEWRSASRILEQLFFCVSLIGVIIANVTLIYYAYIADVMGNRGDE